MSYRINYTAKGVQKKNLKQIYICPAASISIIAAIMLLIGFYYVSNNIEHTIHMLFPWMNESINIAISEFESNVSNGISVTDAFATFCKEMITHGFI